MQNATELAIAHQGRFCSTMPRFEAAHFVDTKLEHADAREDGGGRVNQITLFERGQVDIEADLKVHLLPGMSPAIASPPSKSALMNSDPSCIQYWPVEPCQRCTFTIWLPCWAPLPPARASGGDVMAISTRSLWDSPVCQSFWGI